MLLLVGFVDEIDELGGRVELLGRRAGQLGRRR
jgi:hypothetical protein